MKRIALTAFSTLAVLVLLFLYPTSTGNSGTTAAEAVSAARVVTSGGTTATTTGQGPDPATAGSAGTGSTTGSSRARGATASPSAPTERPRTRTTAGRTTANSAVTIPRCPNLERRPERAGHEIARGAPRLQRSAQGALDNIRRRSTTLTRSSR